MKKFKEDISKTKPGLHLLYVKQGIIHLKALDDCIQRLDNLSNLNMFDAIIALQKERAKLVAQNAAYADAEEILLSLKGKEEEC